MADLNALIAQGTQFKAPPDPFEQYGKMQQLTQGQQLNQLNAMKLQEAQRGYADQNALRQLNPTSADYLAQVTRINPELGFKFGKLHQEAKTAELSQKKTAVELAKTKREFVQQAQRDTSHNPSDANITAFKEDLLANPDFTDAEKAQLAAGADRLLAMPVAERQAFMASQGASAGELKPTLTPQNLGGSTQMLSTPAFGGAAQVVPGSAFGKTAAPTLKTPEEEAQLRRIAASGRAPASVQSQFFRGSDGNVYEAVKGTGAARPVFKPDGQQLAAAEYNPELAAVLAASKAGGKTGIELATKDYGTAQSSLAAMPKVEALITQLERGDVNTGAAADVILGMNKAMALLGGAEAAKRATNTEIADVMMGSDVFPLIQSLGVGARGMDTPAEREFMRSVLTGSLKLEKGTLLEMAKMRKEIMQKNVDRWNSSIATGSRDRFFESTQIPKAPLGSSAASTGAWTSADQAELDQLRARFKK